MKVGADQVTTELATSQKEVTSLEGELDAALREKETLKVRGGEEEEEVGRVWLTYGQDERTYYDLE